MPKLSKLTTVFVKTETTQGSAATTAATDALLVEDFSEEPVQELFQRPFYGSSLDSRTALVGKTAWNIKFKTELKNGGTRGTIYAPLDACLQAVGLTSTATPATSVVYAPSSAAASANFYGPGKSLTIEWYRNGVKHVAAGCIGKMKITFKAGAVCYFEFEFKGVYAAPTDADPGTATYVTTLPPLGVSATLSLQSVSAIVENLSIEDGNDVVERPSLSAATGILGYMIAGRAPKGAIDPEMESLATHAIFTKLTTPTEGALTLTLGGTSGNIVAISCPKVQYTGIKYADRNGILVSQLDLQLNRSTGDDWLTLTLT
jgi:hypothetical protein